MKSTILTASVCALVLACAAPQKGGKADTTDKALRTGMLLVSTAFNDGELIPKKYSGYGENVSPDLAWAQAPEGGRSFALICRDPDAPGGTFYHWVVFNIPDSVKQLPGGIGHASALPFGGTQGTNSFGKVGYDGPKPPVGTHHYFFDLDLHPIDEFGDHDYERPEALEHLVATPLAVGGSGGEQAEGRGDYKHRDDAVERA